MKTQSVDIMKRLTQILTARAKQRREMRLLGKRYDTHAISSRYRRVADHATRNWT